MKKIYLLLFLLSISFVFSQNKEVETDEIAEAEMKSASKFLNIEVNPNTQNYDVTYHELRFTVNPSNYYIDGKVTTTYTALSDMNTVTFELFSGLTVSSVKKNNINLTFTQNTNDELVITLPTTQLTGTSATVEIEYAGAPNSNGFGSFNTSTHSGSPILWTLSEPFGARDWWPCKQDLNDKIDSIDVYITAPSQYVSVSNGIEPEAPVVTGGNKTTHFHHGYPIPAYLVCMAVTNYAIYNQTAGVAPNTFPVINYVYPENLASVQSQIDYTPSLLDFFGNLFEIYPFHNEKYGHAQFGWGGGMEHTTVSFMVNFSRQLIAHEMAHQWFGDKVTCGTWKDIWLNEGFATYLASLVIENFDGNAAFVSNKNSMINSITSQPNGAVYLTDSEALNVNRIFSSRLSYSKGAMVLEMLRWKLGDAVFFQGLRNYLADSNLAYGYAITSDLQSHLETVYGSSLTEFFNDWVYNQGYPTYTITAQNWGSGQVKITVNQTQSHSSVAYFEMPVPIRLLGSGGQTYDTFVENTTNGQEFIIPVPFNVTGIQFDPEKHLISKNSSATLGNENFDVDKSISLYPNPSKDIVSIQMPNDLILESVIFYNSLGQEIKIDNQKNINVTQLSSGIYFVNIVTDLGNKTIKFIKQ
jgi:aminopeptidase N